MSWKYLIVFLCSLGVDVVPIPLPPAFTVMIFLQIQYHLPIWPIIIIGVAGSIVGRYLFTLYIPFVSSSLFKKEKNEQVQFLGEKLKSKVWKGRLFILLYSLLPIPTTPLFLAAGMGKIKPFYIIPPFFIGKFISDALAVVMGKYAVENTANLLQGVLSWRSIAGLIVGLLLIAAIVFIDWRILLLHKKIKLNFRIWK